MPVLEPGEEVIMGENTKYFGREGYLTLTNRRLIFDQTRGLITKRTYTSVELPLDAISDVTVEGIFKKLIIRVRPGYVGGITSRLEFAVRDPFSWQNRLLLVKKAMPVTTILMGWTCPTCAHLNPQNMAICHRCGTSKQAVYQAPPKFPAKPISTTKSCISCGEKIPTDAAFCPLCGKKQKLSSKAKRKKLRKRRKIKKSKKSRLKKRK